MIGERVVIYRNGEKRSERSDRKEAIGEKEARATNDIPKKEIRVVCDS